MPTLLKCLISLVGATSNCSLSCWLLTSLSAAAPKTHAVTLGKWTSVPWFTGGAEAPRTLRVRPLFVDGRLKEYILASPHDVTDHLFVVQRAFRVNDSLPEELASPPRWQWQRGGWLLVDRATGHVSAINLPDFDAFYSTASWYRDYAAYCGVSDDGKRVHAMVAQISRRKPVLKKPFGESAPVVTESDTPDSACPAPSWQRAPTRVSFETAGNTRQTFAIRGHVVDLVADPEEDEEASK
jgi:hypothetical protein